MGEMASLREVHGKDLVARFESAEVNSHVGLRA